MSYFRSVEQAAGEQVFFASSYQGSSKYRPTDRLIKQLNTLIPRLGIKFPFRVGIVSGTPTAFYPNEMDDDQPQSHRADHDT